MRIVFHKERKYAHTWDFRWTRYLIAKLIRSELHRKSHQKTVWCIYLENIWAFASRKGRNSSEYIEFLYHNFMFFRFRIQRNKIKKLLSVFYWFCNFFVNLGNLAVNDIGVFNVFHVNRSVNIFLLHRKIFYSVKIC